MKSFSCYVKLKLNEMDGAGNSMAVDLPDSGPANKLSDQPKTADEKTDNNFTEAINIAVKKYRNQMERFLKKLGENDPEIRNLLNDESPIDRSGINDGETVSPAIADMG